MKERIELRREGKAPSQVIIGNALSALSGCLPAGRRVVVITDGNVHRRYREMIDRYEHLLIGVGETGKTLAAAMNLYGELLALGADRSTFILGIGGGIVTDITGFVASTYMRGLSFGFVPTTLLAQVDASVGGKNGVNFEGYKNMVGTFNQPDFVLCDLSLLRTLPDREFRAGLAEVIKSGLIADRELFDLFGTHTFGEFRDNGQLLLDAVTRAVRIKAGIVVRDEQEHGERRKLNLGHTFGHAIEKVTRDFLHGEAVAIGTVMAARISARLGTAAPEEEETVRRVIEKMGLPSDSGQDIRKLLRALRLDKKKKDDRIDFVLLKGLGDCEVRSLTFGEIEKLEL